MRSPARLAASTFLLATSLVARADVIEASSTTLLAAGQQLRGTPAGQQPDLVERRAVLRDHPRLGP